MIIELLIMLFCAIFAFSYRKQNGENVYSTISDSIKKVYNRLSPYSYQEVREKCKELGQEFSPKEYLFQIIIIGGLFAAVGYLYFYSLIWAIVYAAVAIMFIPYLNFLKQQKTYSEYIFEEIQVYCTNVINEFNTTQSFVKSLEGVVQSGILEEPVLTDVKKMIEMSYQNGTIDEAVEWFSTKYPYYMVKNMHQLFLQITNEGARNSADALDNMSLDIDMLVEGVYRDRMDRAQFHKKFLTFGFVLYLMVMLVQLLLGVDKYIDLLSSNLLVKFLLHAIIIINTYFLLNGEKYYNENVGAE